MGAVTEEEMIRRIVRAAVREVPGPYRMRLAMAEWEQIKRELREAELAAMAAYHGVE